MPTPIASRDNARIKAACRLRESTAERARQGLFFAESPKLCLELAKGCACETLFCTAAALASHPALADLTPAVFEVSDPVAEKLAGQPSPQGVFGLFRLPQFGTDILRTGGHYLCMEAVQDPGNVGAVIRSAAAFGFDAVVCSAGCASPFSPKALRASMGAAGRMPIVQVEDMAQTAVLLRGKGVKVLAAALYNSRPLSDVPGPFPDGVAVVIGNEGQGLRDETVAACTAAVRIPMTGRVESLNAAAAGAVLAWHFRGEVNEG